MLGAALFVCACGSSGPQGDLLFVDGRAVAAAGDSVLAHTQQGHTSVVLRDRGTGAIYERGEQTLHSPFQVQEYQGGWYVSDVVDREWWIVQFTPQWEVAQRIRIDTIATAPHQFAVLPDGRLVVEAADGRLVAIAGDSVTTFALTDASPRTGLVMGALGGVLHAVQDREITLYNGAGNIRWRLSWPWDEGAFVADLALDAQGRIHVLAGRDGSNQFYAYSLDRNTGQVIRWSILPGSSATFVIAPTATTSSTRAVKVSEGVTMNPAEFASANANSAPSSTPVAPPMTQANCSSDSERPKADARTRTSRPQDL